MGWTRRKEIRQAEPVDAFVTNVHFTLLGYPLLYIDEIDALTTFLRIGGHAVITQQIIESYWTEILNPRIVVETHEPGYVDYETINHQFKNRFARGNLRMEIFDRDNYRCRIFGANPDLDIHVQLEQHHIKPWEEGGISSPENLITLCVSCHTGANTIDRDILYRKIGLSFPHLKNKIYGRKLEWNQVQVRSYDYLLSNTVSLRVKNRNQDSVITKMRKG